MNEHWSDNQIVGAEVRGRALLESEPRATAVRYDSRSDRVVVELSNGATFAFPPRLAQDLDGATAGQLGEVEIVGAGFGLHWPGIEADLSLPGLLAGRFGTDWPLLSILSVCAALVFGALLGLVAVGYYWTTVSKTLLFWTAFILTRPLGAVVGDFLDKPVLKGGLALDRYSASAVLFAFIVASVLLFPQRAASKSGH